MAEKYYSILTNRGKELEAQSSATGKPVIIKDFVVGDGNGKAVTPDPARTSLVKEVYRGAISALQISPDQTNQFIAQLALGTDVGGFVVREVGLLTDAGELYSVANCAAIEKPENSVSVSLQYRLAVSETANIELKTATGDGLFLRLDKNLTEIAANGTAAQKEARKAIGIMDASAERKGLVQLSSATDSESETQAATPKAVKALKDSLGSAAFKSVQTSKDDITAGRLVVNGGALALRSVRARASGGDVTDVNALPPNSVSFTYSDPTNSPGFNGSLIDFSGLNGEYSVQLTATYANSGKNISFRTRNGDNKTWNPWYEIFHTGNPPTTKTTFQLAEGIANAANLNNYTDPGLYYQPANAQAAAGTNYPEAIAGSLEVYKHAGITQIYRVYNNSRSYIRTLYGGTWTAWIKQYDAANKPTAADVGALASNGNAVSATRLQTSRTIGGVGFDGTANINLPGVNTQGNQNTTGNAATATRLQTARTINGVSFNGTANITISASAIGSYTKAESDARYVQNTRRGPQQFMTPGENGIWNGFELGSGYMTGTRNHTDDGNAKFSQYYYRVQQVYIQSKGWVDTGSA